MIYSHVGRVVYADGSEFTLPPILTSRNGWVYKPDKLRTEKEISQGRNKTFARSSGASDAHDYLMREIFYHFERRGWEVPVLYESETQPEYDYGDSLAVAWKDETWGWVTSSLSMRSHSILLRVSAANLAMWMLEKKVHRREKVSASVEVKLDDIPAFVNSWIKDPWGTATSHLVGDWSVFGDPPKGIYSQEFLKDDQRFSRPRYGRIVESDVVSTSKRNGLYFREGVVEEVLLDRTNWKALQEMFSAMQYLGFDLSTSWRWSEAGKVLKGLTVGIPEQEGMHEHTIKFGIEEPQIRITCGYVKDDEKWLEYQRRKAAQFLEEIEEEMEVEND